MNDNHIEDTVADDLHRHQVAAVQNAVANLIVKLGYPADVVAEGAIKGAAVALLATGADIADVSALLKDFAISFETLDRPNLQVVT